MYLKSGKTKFLFYLNVIKEMQECHFGIISHFILKFCKKKNKRVYLFIQFNCNPTLQNGLNTQLLHDVQILLLFTNIMKECFLRKIKHHSVLLLDKRAAFDLVRTGLWRLSKTIKLNHSIRVGLYKFTISHSLPSYKSNSTWFSLINIFHVSNGT